MKNASFRVYKEPYVHNEPDILVDSSILQFQLQNIDYFNKQHRFLLAERRTLFDRIICSSLNVLTSAMDQLNNFSEVFHKTSGSLVSAARIVTSSSGRAQYEQINLAYELSCGLGVSCCSSCF